MPGAGSILGSVWVEPAGWPFIQKCCKGRAVLQVSTSSISPREKVHWLFELRCLFMAEEAWLQTCAYLLLVMDRSLKRGYPALNYEGDIQCPLLRQHKLKPDLVHSSLYKILTYEYKDVPNQDR